jgi:serine/threonine protein kinase
MLTDPDVLLLKLALERELLDASRYRRVVETLRGGAAAGTAGRVLRQAGVAPERVSELAELIASASSDPKGQILARCDLEDAIVARAVERNQLVPPDRLQKAQQELRGLNRLGEIPSLTELLVKRRWLEVTVAVELRRRARARIATCRRCRRHYIVDPDKAKVGHFQCRDCQIPLEPGEGANSAVDVAKGLPREKPAAPIAQSQLLKLPPEQIAALKAAKAAAALRDEERRAREAQAYGRVATPVPPSPSALDLAAGAAAPNALGRGSPPPAPPKKYETGRIERSQKETKADQDEPAAAPSASGVGDNTRDDPSNPKSASWDSVDDAAESVPAATGAAVATFGEYDILSEVARGGMGIVYKARRHGTNKVLALKVLISGVDATAEQVRRFELEGETARTIRHPGIVRVYDAGRHEGYHYIAMEFVEGKTLELLISKGAFEPRRAAHIIRDVARAVHEIHKNSIIHRDLKPGNVIVNDADEPKLIDFGLAKSIDRRAKLTRSGAAIGTPYYMPPEQVRGEADKIGPASDVYALGAIFFEMLSGEVPFRADNPIELYHKIASSELVLPQAFQKNVPAELKAIIARCMEKKPEDRYPSAQALADDLDAFIHAMPIAPHKKASRMPGSRFSGLTWALGGTGVGLLVLTVGLAVFVTLETPEREARRLQKKGRRALVEKNLEDARDYFKEGLKTLADDPSLEVDLARSLAVKDPGQALAALERADLDGLRDASSLDAPELSKLTADKRFKAVVEHVRARR